MGAYIFRRLLLIIPTLFGIMVINFTLTQFVPGGPIEQILARLDGSGDVFENIAGGSGDVDTQALDGGDSGYVGARGLPREFIEELEREFGLDNPAYQRIFVMMWNYMRLEFGESYLRTVSATGPALTPGPQAS